MPSKKQPAVYIVTNAERGTLYIGVTGWLKQRIHEHREGLIDGFTKRYRLSRLVWFEFHTDFACAIRRETQLKKWNRMWKIELVESTNRDWRDLWPNLLD
ncbi:MAG TPA: GIY-YIG nuclease family protein [Rhodanobacteraceae bacterium]|jgi:putative endonuclease|nr:GIY-YIG nuclease family protein [Rhodanobacteraceae bacterium]